MGKTQLTDAERELARKMGRSGGLARVPKGFAKMDKARARELRLKSAASNKAKAARPFQANATTDA